MWFQVVASDANSFVLFAPRWPASLADRPMRLDRCSCLILFFRKAELSFFQAQTILIENVEGPYTDFVMVTPLVAGEENPTQQGKKVLQAVERLQALDALITTDRGFALKAFSREVADYLCSEQDLNLVSSLIGTLKTGAHRVIPP